MLTSTRRHRSVDTSSPYSVRLPSEFDDQLEETRATSPQSKGFSLSPYGELRSTEDVSIPEENMSSPLNCSGPIGAGFISDDSEDIKSADEYNVKPTPAEVFSPDAKDARDSADSVASVSEQDSMKIAADSTIEGARDQSIKAQSGDVIRLNAKRARVENIVTNIRVKPDRVLSPTASSSKSDQNAMRSSSAPINTLPNRKRHLSEQIRSLQEQISNLQHEYHNGTSPSSMALSQPDAKTMKETTLTSARDSESELVKQNIDEIVKAASSPSQFISQAMKLVAAVSGAEKSSVAGTGESMAEGWGHQQPKRQCLDTDDEFVDSPMKIQPRYQAAIKLSVTDALNEDEVNSSYQILVKTLKKELALAFEAVAEKSAKRILQELRLKLPSNKQVCDATEHDDDQESSVFYQSDRQQKNLGNPEDHNGKEHLDSNLYSRPNVSSFIVEGKQEKMRTTSQSQMCFGNVEVRKRSSAGNTKPNSPRDGSIYPGLPSVYGRYQGSNVNPVEATHHENLIQSRSSSVNDRPQTQALSLVTRKLTKDRNQSPSSFDSLTNDDAGDDIGRCSSNDIDSDARLPSTAKLQSASVGPQTNCHLQHAASIQRKLSRDSPSITNTSKTQRRSRSRSPDFMESKQQPSTSPYLARPGYSAKDPSFFASANWPSIPDSSAFRNTLGHQSLSPTHDHYSRFFKPENIRNKVRSVNMSGSMGQHKTPLSTPMIGGSMFRNPSYPPASNTSSSIYPFTSPQLPFPLHPVFQQGHLARALASDYNRIRDSFDPSGGIRFISTRTPTRDTIKPRASMLSGHHIDSKCVSPDYGSPCSDVGAYSSSMQEGLTPQHLKKAKLMFFYTRYPSANMLKAYFADVKFSRATTSQLIKWFSNFREFYYIQMEKFARQALTEGITDVNQILVTRDSEILRVLNLHYNKSNDFRVPDQFIDVTQTSLQEFYLSIKAGKDRDPAWKKVIYKVICKLDHDVPDIFKSANVLDRLCDAHL
nr:uncharacterized protein LOC778983 isoform X1 [Ciona intestinalis]|eukprot:XP_002122608.1 uncharacterized protein LOC778983 isoform X1 [Ciona intestinalis]